MNIPDQKSHSHVIIWVTAAGAVALASVFGVAACVLVQVFFGFGDNGDSFIPAKFDLSGISRFGENERGLSASYRHGYGEIVEIDFARREAKSTTPRSLRP